nr:serine/threonine-protein phosphatase with EF-hands 2 isoform X3 [Microcebus murinus]XP_012599809.1 serine/threonine-protein phosphatase with EF-hands 2 isoform X3 [Microcebus murinus]
MQKREAPSPFALLGPAVASCGGFARTMGSGTSTQHHLAFQNAEKAFRAAALIQRWYRRHAARLEMRRRCTWSIFQSIEYAGQQDQGKLHDFFSYLMDHFTPSSHNERDFLNRMFTGEGLPQDSETERCSDYESVEVPDSYVGPRLSFPLLPAHATALVEAFRLRQQLHARYVLHLLHEAKKHLVQLPNITRVSTCYSEEVTVCGDLHGQLDDLIFIFYKNGLPSPERVYVFNGDFVDRGKDSVEILMVLFAFMLVYPKEFHLNRGNHEDHMVNLRYGFTKEVMNKYKIHGKKILRTLQDVFRWLPLATLVDEKVLILHGGVSDTTDLELLDKLDRHKVVDILWSDPMAQEGCRANTGRGGGCYFGPDVTERLLQKHNLQFLIRSHECKPEGYEFCHSRKVLTIFSASNYYEVGSNRGAYVKLGPALTPHIVQYQANKATCTLTMRQRISRVEESALRALREKLFAHSSDLLGEFKKYDAGQTEHTVKFAGKTISKPIRPGDHF